MSSSAVLPSRPAVVTALRDAVAAELAAVERVAAMARDEVGSGEAKAESKYDTRSTEASYLARGQAWRVADLRRQLAWLEVFDADRALNPPVVQVGALVVLDGEADVLFIAPVGGATAEVQGRTVRVVSPASPLGEAMADLEAGDAFEVDTPQGIVEREVAALW